MGAAAAEAKVRPEAQKLPPLPLAAAGFAVLDVLIAAAYIGMWAVQRETALAIIQAMAGLSMLLGIAPIVIGGLILNQNRRTESAMPGSSWANVSILSGLLLLAATVLLPLISALAVLVGGSA